MTNFKTKLDEDVSDCFLNTDEFAETITYTPSGGTGKSIKAVVKRERLNTSNEDTGRVLLNQAEIFVANDSIAGVSSVSKGADKVSFPALSGGSNATWLVVDIIEHDDAMWHLLVQK